MIPSAKTAALLKAPPVKTLIKPSRSLGLPLLSVAAASTSGITPGNTTKEPKRKTMSNPRVKRIRVLSSLIFQMFCSVVINFFICDYLMPFFPLRASNTKTLSFHPNLPKMNARQFAQAQSIDSFN